MAGVAVFFEPYSCLRATVLDGCSDKVIVEACEARAYLLRTLELAQRIVLTVSVGRETELQFMDTEKTVNHTLLRTVLFSVKMKLVLSEAPERLFFSSIFVVDL